MKDKLYKYLKSMGGCASSVAIVGQLLNIRGARRDVAEKIVVSWVKDHPLFVSDGLGNWYINPEEETKGILLNEVLFNLVDIRGNAGDLSNSSLLEIAVCQIRNGKAKEINFDIAVRGKNSLQSNEPLAHEAKPWQEILGKLLSILESGVLTGFNLVPVRNFIYMEAMRYFGEYLAFEELSLRDLSRHLYPKQRIKTPSDLADLLGVQYFESDEVKVQVNNLANLFLALLNKLPDLGLTSLDEVLAFQLPKRKQVNLDDKKINRRFLENLPQSPGVYLLKNNQGEVIYVGKAKNLKSRVGSYFYAREKLETKLAEIWANIFDIEIVDLGSELEAFLEERKLIKKFKRPPVNQPNIYY
ncbi:MAG: GIY-YIG nuclease family protein, partial [bacterium]